MVCSKYVAQFHCSYSYNHPTSASQHWYNLFFIREAAGYHGGILMIGSILKKYILLIFFQFEKSTLYPVVCPLLCTPIGSDPSPSVYHCLPVMVIPLTFQCGLVELSLGVVIQTITIFRSFSICFGNNTKIASCLPAHSHQYTHQVSYY